jgi:hypothetical protein
MFNHLRYDKRRFVAAILAIALITLILPMFWPASSAGETDSAQYVQSPLAYMSPGAGEYRVPGEQKLPFHAYVQALQFYRWNGAVWPLGEPAALLFDIIGTTLEAPYTAEYYLYHGEG